MMTPTRSPAELARMRAPGRAIGTLFRALREHIRENVPLCALERFVKQQMKNSGLASALHGRCGFPARIACSVNETAAHGVPDRRRLRRGDLLTVDISVEREGWYADAAWTYAVGAIEPDRKRLLQGAWRAARAAVEAARPGHRFGEIAVAVDREARRFGLSVLESCAGHGIGRSLHEPPRILHTGSYQGERIPPWCAFTVEPVLSLGGPDVQLGPDGHSLVTVDRAPTAQFEHTVLVRPNGPEVLTTRDPVNVDFPPFF